MFIAFLLEGIGVWALYVYGQNPLGFVLLSGFLRLGRDLQPLSSDLHRLHATTNAGLLCTAKGTASLLVPLANVLVMETEGWKGAFIIAALFNVAAALMAIFVLKPMRQELVARQGEKFAWVAGMQPEHNPHASHQSG